MKGSCPVLKERWGLATAPSTLTLQKIKINGQYVDKAFCTRCPKCGWGLPSMLSIDGSECCLKCDYQRQVYIAEELPFWGKNDMEKLQTKYGHTFSEYQGHRIFSKQVNRDWFVITYRTGEAAAVSFPALVAGLVPD